MMDSFKNVRKTWDSFAEEKPQWSFLTSNQPQEVDAFFQSGEQDIAKILLEAVSYGLAIRKETALDFGCGLGRLTFPLCSRFRQVSAVDISQKMIELASSHGDCPENATFQRLESSGLRFLESNSFDLVVSLIVLQHVPRRHMKSYIKQFMRVVKPNGTIVFQVTTFREKIETGKAEFWKGKPLSWDRPSFPKLCYRFISRSIPWTRKMLKRPLLSNEARYRLECGWKKMTGRRIMQMNTLGIQEVELIASRNSCKIVAVREDERAGRGFTSNLFFLTKVG